MDRVRGPRTLRGDINGNLTHLFHSLMSPLTHFTALSNDDYLSWCFSTCAGNILPEKNEHGGCRKDEDKVELAEQSLLNKLIRRSLVRNRNQVEVLQRDPSSPLYSVKTFEELRL